MSVFFVTDDGNDLWNPSNLTARLFCDQAKSVARLLGIESGLGDVVSDEVVVSRERFTYFSRQFADLLLRTDPTSGAYRMMEGCFCISGALAEKLNAPSLGGGAIAHLVSKGRQITG